jgi:hypothetical protein
MPITKKQDLNLGTFLHIVIYPLNKEINKHFNINLGDTNDVKFNLNSLLDFNSIKNHIKLRVLFSANRTILDITFKFMAGLNM